MYRTLDLAGLDQSGEQNIHEKLAYATKKFYLEGVTLHSDEFTSAERTLSRSCSSSGDASTLINRDHSPTTNGEKEGNNLVLCGKLSGRHEIAVRLKQCDTIPGPKVYQFNQICISVLRINVCSHSIRLNWTSNWGQPSFSCLPASCTRSTPFSKP